ncbi:MAG: TetR family transcriptional regulator [Alphaproteobacteria bacterium]|nr:TetR family transcriptional regulator [Alphaproteobacteria bacterium]
MEQKEQGAPARRYNPEQTRAVILDAAEQLFAEHGYEGASIRDIASLASFRLGMITYHFGTKEELFRQVIARRADDYVSATATSLDAAVSRADGAPGTEAVIRAYLQPAIELSARGGAGWKNYLQLLARAMNTRQHEAFLEPVLRTYDPLVRKIVAVFRLSRPEMDEAQLHWAFYFLQAAFIHILVEAGIVDRHSHGLCRSSDLDAILDEMVPFFAAGFDRLARHAPAAAASRR